jgi:hypothetical protein
VEFIFIGQCETFGKIMDLKVWSANGFAILFSLMNEANEILQTIVLILTATYTIISIYQKLKK